MNILKDIIKGASSQFGREFGRAGANAILKGANAYTVKSIDDYQGRIKSSDSSTVKEIKNIEKVKFVSTNKANVSRLIELTDSIIPFIDFKGDETLLQLPDLIVLIKQYNNKFEQGDSLVDNDFEGKSIDLLNEKRNEYNSLIKVFNNNIDKFVKENLESARQNKKLKNISLKLAFPVWGSLGLHQFYLGRMGLGIFNALFSMIAIFGVVRFYFGYIGADIMYVFLAFLVIPLLISIIDFIELLVMSTEKFDNKYNLEFSFYNKFKKIK